MFLQTHKLLNTGAEANQVEECLCATRWQTTRNCRYRRAVYVDNCFGRKLFPQIAAFYRILHRKWRTSRRLGLRTPA